MKLAPVRNLYTKAWMTFATITVFVAAGAGMATLVISLAADDPGDAVPILWVQRWPPCGSSGPRSKWLWIGNLSYETPATVTGRLRGTDRTGKVHLIDDGATRARYVRDYLDRFPYTTPSGRPRFFGERWHPDDAELTKVAQAIVMVGIDREE